VLERVTIGCDIEALSDAGLVVEAASEDEAIKTELFGRLDQLLVRDDAVLASNTSSIPIMKLGTATARPEQVVGMHFFNPVPVLALVEIVPSLLTSQRTVQQVQELAEKELGKTVIHSQDRAGFIVNALLVPYLLSGVRMLESGFASAQDIDAGMVRGCAHPMGPLQLSDLIGLDTVKAIAESLYAEFKEPLFSPPPMLLRMVEAGLLGRKTGRGFYEYARP
jgi:3-hydroxybutyryl-CoA dehydrogenase